MEESMQAKPITMVDCRDCGAIFAYAHTAFSYMYTHHMLYGVTEQSNTGIP